MMKWPIRLQGGQIAKHQQNELFRTSQKEHSENMKMMMKDVKKGMKKLQ